MYDVRDKVIIHGERASMAMPGSPLRNLEGTVAEIKEVKRNHSNVKYKLRFIDLKVKDWSLYEDAQCDLAWEDRHLEPYTEDIDEKGLENILKDGGII